MSSVAPLPHSDPDPLSGEVAPGHAMTRARLIDRLADMGPAAPQGLAPATGTWLPPPEPPVTYLVSEAAPFSFAEALPDVPPPRMPLTEAAPVEFAPPPVPLEPEAALELELAIEAVHPQARLVTLIREQRALLDRMTTATPIPAGHAPEPAMAAAEVLPDPPAMMHLVADGLVHAPPVHAPPVHSADEIIRRLAGVPAPGAGNGLAETAQFASQALLDAEPPPMIIERARSERNAMEQGLVPVAAPDPPRRSLPAFLAGLALSGVIGVGLYLLLRSA